MVALNHAHFIVGQSGTVAASEGPPGSAKTASHEALAIATKRRFQSYRLDELIPEDIGGYPVRDELEFGGKKFPVMRRLPDERLLRCLLEPSVVLIDELTNVGGAMQAAALQLINDGIGKYLAQLAGDPSLYSKDRTWIFAAFNPIEQAASGNPLTPPLVNRMWIGKWQTDFETWHAGMERGLKFEAPSVPILPENWRDTLPHYGRVVSQFLRVRNELREAIPDDPMAMTKPYPTIRSWANVARALAAADSVSAGEEVIAEICTGLVGEGAGLELAQWMSQKDVPDPEVILANPAGLVLPRAASMPVVILGAVVNAVRTNKTPDRWERAIDVLEVAYPQAPEFAVSYLGVLLAQKPQGHLPKRRTSDVYKEMSGLVMEGAKR